MLCGINPGRSQLYGLSLSCADWTCAGVESGRTNCHCKRTELQLASSTQTVVNHRVYESSPTLGQQTLTQRTIFGAAFTEAASRRRSLRLKKARISQI